MQRSALPDVHPRPRRGRVARRWAPPIWVVHPGESADAANVRVAVRAAVSLHASPTRLRNGRLLTLRGRVEADPRRGLVVILEARVGGLWQTFKTAGTNADGAFRASWRFRYTYAKQTYRLRARVRRQTDYPYTAGVSRVLKVVVG